MCDRGETFNEAFSRAMKKINEVMKKQKNGNAMITTHNSMFGLIKLWNEEGRPTTASKDFRIKYTKQDNTNPTGSWFIIKNGGHRR